MMNEARALLPLAAASLLLASCHPSGSTAPDAGGGTACEVAGSSSVAAWTAAIQGCSATLTDELTDTRPRTTLDVLFLVDNSPGMALKQRALAQSIPGFLQVIAGTNASYHLGITTSDVGSYTAPNTPWPVSLGSCNTFAGDDGALQSVACSLRSGASPDEQSACTVLCPDPSFVPSDGTRFISADGGTNNVKASDSLAPQKAFQCMALVGDTGCGIEGQLEGAKRALDGHNASNAGFLRADSVLAVVFITDEDDCSVSLAGRAENNPTTMDCQAPDKNAAAACFNLDYRCMARDLICDEALNVAGTKHNCVERDSSYLDPISKYQQFFASLRSRNRLFVGGIWAPSLAHGGVFNVLAFNGGTKSSDLNRGTMTDASCASATDPSFYARPQVRLSKLAAGFKDSMEVNLCDTAHYADALNAIAKAITTKLSVECLNDVPLVVAGAPACLVGEIDASTPAAVPAAAYPLCGSSCCQAFAAADVPAAATASVTAACSGETTAACYCALPSTAAACSGGAVAGVWRKSGTPQPEGKKVRFVCRKSG